MDVLAQGTAETVAQLAAVYSVTRRDSTIFIAGPARLGHTKSDEL
jgi:hypothetical protein